MQGMKQYCENCKEFRGLHNDCPNLTEVKTHYETFVKNKDEGLYTRYKNIFSRCNYLYPNSKSSYYKGRGIKCLWKNYQEFKDDMYEGYLKHIQKFGRRNTVIDRIDGKGNYCKENCRWVTYAENCRNMPKRKKRNE